jgi:hypothetical protein
MRLVEGFWPIFFMAVILKIPVAALLYLVWWAVKSPEQPAEQSDDGGGFRRHTPPPRPRGPRRGPHAPDARPLPDCPPAGRTRVVTRPTPVRAGAGHRRAE